VQKKSDVSPDWQAILEASKPLLANWCIGEEIAPSTGTPHLQGYIEFKTKRRPSELAWPPQIHWEVSRGSRAQNLAYCSKSGQVVTNLPLNRPLKLIECLKPWQQGIIDLVQTIPDDRSIHWYWEPEGHKGKTALCRLLCAKYNSMFENSQSNL
jgi:hypothetical protein